jgi:serine/threonine-protein kinase
MVPPQTRSLDSAGVTKVGQMFPGEIDVQPSTYLEHLGTIFARFAADRQGSGNVSYGVQAADARYFVKTAGDPADTSPYLDFDGRVALLRNAAKLASVVHPLLPTLHAVIESPCGPLLVYDWRDGEHLGTERNETSSAHQRFRALPVEEIVAALNALYDLHADLDAAGWVAGDFYDGSLLYDFERRQLTVLDLDSYQHGPYRNTMGRMFGARRFMAPEEFSLGAPIDTRTTAYVLARAGLIFLSDASLDRAAFRGSDAQYAVLQEATTTRYPTYPAFHQAWQSATGA